MKKLLVSCALCAFVATGALAQVKAYKADQVSASNTVAYSLPRTVVQVRIVAERECVRVGPYARFAQKYLGVIAPLADKNLYTIQSATLCGMQEADPAEVYVLENPDKTPLKLYEPTAEGLIAADLDGTAHVPFVGGAKKIHKGSNRISVVSYVQCDTAFLKVPIDKQGTIEKTPEAMAASAANQIFALRKNRLDLVTGEAGENVFGAGLKAALQEIDRLEQEYMALFLGKQYRETFVKVYSVIPTKGENTAVVCRFSEAAGLLVDTDLSGRPIVLEMTPEQKVEKSPLANRKGSKDGKGMVFYRIADMVNCRLTDGGREIAQDRMPIYQCGMIVQIPVAAVK